MRRLYRLSIDFLVDPGVRHRRDWRRLWRYCRCGFRWRCPDSIELVPMPYAPEVPPPARRRARNVRDPLWNGTAGRNQKGRIGALTSGQAGRVRRAEEARAALR